SLAPRAWWKVGASPGGNPRSGRVRLFVAGAQPTTLELTISQSGGDFQEKFNILRQPASLLGLSGLAGRGPSYTIDMFGARFAGSERPGSNPGSDTPVDRKRCGRLNTMAALKPALSQSGNGFLVVRGEIGLRGARWKRGSTGLKEEIVDGSPSG